MDRDAELLAAWRAGDRVAGDAVVRLYFESVLRFFRTKLGDDVEDLVQQTFLDLVAATETTEIQSIRATLFTIARRRLLDHLRARYRREPVELVSSVSVADLGTSPSGAVARTEQERVLRDALRRIPLDLQTALELAYWEDLSGPEIAAILQIPPETVRSRLSRAREALREQVMKMANTPASALSTMEELDRRVAI